MPSLKITAIWLREEVESLKERAGYQSDFDKAVEDGNEDRKEEFEEKLNEWVLVPWGVSQLWDFLEWGIFERQGGAKDGMVEMKDDSKVFQKAIREANHYVWLKSGKDDTKPKPLRSRSRTPATTGGATPQDTTGKDTSKDTGDTIAGAMAKLGEKSKVKAEPSQFTFDGDVVSDGYKIESWKQYIRDFQAQTSWQGHVDVAQNSKTGTMPRKCGREIHRSLWHIMYGSKMGGGAKIDKIIHACNGMPWQVGEDQNKRGWEEALVSRHYL